MGPRPERPQFGGKNFKEEISTLYDKTSGQTGTYRMGSGEWISRGIHPFRRE